MTIFGIVNLSAFILSSILLTLTPGADTMYILGRSIAQGKKAGIFSALGIVTGVLFHTTFAAFGLSLVVARSLSAFNLIKYAGGAYLAYLGIKMLLMKTMDAHRYNGTAQRSNIMNLYVSGILTNVLNPKVLLFFLVFLPQFVTADHAQNPVPFLVLGFIFFIPGTIWCIMLAIFAASLSDKIKRNTNSSLWLNRLTGSTFIALGIKLALLSRN